MRTIHKLREPASLTEHRAKPGAGFDERGLEFVEAHPDGNPELSKAAKDELRQQLWEEQRGLCCYCCCRISPTESGMRIEHWKPLRRFPEYQLDYWNLMAACPGNELGQGHLRHCDVRKGDQDLSRNPSNPGDRVEEIVRYLSDGTIRSIDTTFDAELGENPLLVPVGSERVLNLNMAFLRNNRLGVLNGFVRGLGKRGPLQREVIQRLLADWSGDGGGTLEPYSPVVVSWLKKRLARS